MSVETTRIPRESDARVSWWDLRIPMRVFLPLLFLVGVYWGKDLISSANCIFMPSFRAFVSERQLFFIYFMISLVGVVFLTAAIFSRSFSCWVVGSLVYLGISEGGIDSIKSSMYASRCTFTPCIPKIFSLSSFAIGILQTATHFYLVQSFWTIPIEWVFFIHAAIFVLSLVTIVVFVDDPTKDHEKTKKVRSLTLSSSAYSLGHRRSSTKSSNCTLDQPDQSEEKREQEQYTVRQRSSSRDVSGSSKEGQGNDTAANIGQPNAVVLTMMPDGEKDESEERSDVKCKNAGDSPLTKVLQPFTCTALQGIPFGIWFLITISGLLGVTSVFLQFFPFFFETAGNVSDEIALFGAAIGYGTKVVMLPPLGLGLQVLSSSPAGHWGFPIIFCLSGCLIFASSLTVLVHVRNNPKVSMIIYALFSTLGRITLGTLIVSMPKTFLLSIFDDRSEELSLALNTTYAYMSIARFGPLQFAFTLFLFYTSDESSGEITALGLTILAAIVCALACVPLCSTRLRESMMTKKP